MSSSKASPSQAEASTAESPVVAAKASASDAPVVAIKAPVKAQAHVPAQAAASDAPSEASASEFLRPLVVRDEDADAPMAICFEHVTKTYKLFKSDRARFLAAFSKRASYKAVNANNDLSFSIGRGEAVAFIGDNGAGKSTALKLITGVVFPTSGRVTVHGRVSALLELSAGFDPQLSGRENIVFRGQLWGLSSQQIRELEPGIIEFAELGDYIDQPMRTYSSGMRARLGFAFASSIKPDILVVDEALSVGDKNFRKKCLSRVHEIMSDSHVTILFVTHSSASAREFCRRGIVLEQGKAIFEGNIASAIEFYEKRNA